MSDLSLRTPDGAPWKRYLPPAAALLLVIALCAGILNFHKESISEPEAGLIKSFVWPSIVVILVLYFRTQAESLLATINDKIEKTTKFQFANVSVETGPGAIPLPKSGEPVTLENVALLHTSFLRPDKTQKYADGRDYYQIEIVVVAPSSTLDSIESVTYRLEKVYENNVIVTTERNSRFKLKDLANGTSIVRAELKFRGQEQPLYLNRFIDLRPTGPRI